MGTKGRELLPALAPTPWPRAVERVLAPDRPIDMAPDVEAATPVSRYLERLRLSHASLIDGSVATYIPELALADPASKRLRTEAERATLLSSGAQAEVRELQGELTLAG
jgi:hypothetical protein